MSMNGNCSDKTRTSRTKSKSLDENKCTSNCKNKKNRAEDIDNKRILRSSGRGIRTSSRIRHNATVHFRNELVKKEGLGAKKSVNERPGKRKTRKRNSAIQRQMSRKNAERSIRGAARKTHVVSNKKSRRKTTVAQQSPRSQRRRAYDAGTSRQRETQNVFRRNETVTNERIERREPAHTEAIANGNGDGRESESSSPTSIDQRMARLEFLREMVLEIREISRLVEVMGRNFIAEIAEVEIEVSRDHRDSAREFQAFLQNAHRIMEERIIEISNHMMLNINNSLMNHTDRSHSELDLWNAAISILRDAGQSEELETWIADTTLGLNSGGLSEPDINRLPTWYYSSAASRKSSFTAGSNRSVSRKCQICLSFYEGGNLIRTLPCFHDFHATCVDEWLKLSRTCPSCRFEVSF